MQTDHLPRAIVAPLEELAQRLGHWAAAHPDSSLTEQEQAVLQALREAAPDLLTALVQVTQRSLDVRQRRLRMSCPRCGGRARVKSWRKRQVKTLCNTVRWERPWAVCRACRRGFSPTDASLGIQAQQRMSAGLDELLQVLGGAHVFEEAAWLLEATTGLRIGPETVRRRSEAGGEALHAVQKQAMDQVAQTGEPAGPVERPPGQLVAETDGVMVRYVDGWHEVKVGLVGGWCKPSPKSGDSKLLAPSYVAAREDPTTFARRWGAEAARRGALEVVGWRGPNNCEAVLPTVVVLGDGARWIWEAAAEQFGDRIEIVDFYHASEHVWTVARAVFGDGTPESRQWAEARCTELLEQGAEAILKRLAELVTTTSEMAEMVRRERGYFTANCQRMCYPQFRAAGLPIGSGAVESSAKHLVQQRLKRPGARWSEPGARAILTLRAHHLTQRASGQHTSLSTAA